MTVLVGTEDGLYRLDGGSLAPLSGHPVTALTHDDGTTLALVDRRQVWRVANAAAELVVESPSPDLRLTCLATTAEGVLAGSTEARLFRLDNDELQAIESFDDAPGRKAWHTPWGGPPDVRSITVDDSGAYYVNVHVGGIMRSDDAGATWHPTIDLNADVHQVTSVPDISGRVFAATARGLAETQDAGETWEFGVKGLHASYCRSVAVSTDNVLVSSSVGPSGGYAALYRRPLAASADEAFQRCSAGLPTWQPGNIDTGTVAAVSTTVAFGTALGDVYLSEDSGTSWSRVASHLAPVRAVLVEAED